LKKAQVEKHRYKCRRSQTMSCIDCNKDFHLEEYAAHTKCVSENQKYGGANYVSKTNKGEAKQEKWFEQVQRAIDSIDFKKDPRLKSILEQVKNYSNIPRKQQKFESFLKNSLKIRDPNLVGKAWKAISDSVEKEMKIDNAEKKEKIDTQEKEVKKETEIENGEKIGIDKGDQGKIDNQDIGKIDTDQPKKKKDRKKRKIDNQEVIKDIDTDHQKSEIETDLKEKSKTDGSSKKRKIEAAENGSSKEIEPKSESIEDEKPNDDSSTNPEKSENGGRKKFKWNKAIKSFLKSNGKEMKLKKVREEMIDQYRQISNKYKLPEDEVANLFDQALKRLNVRETLVLDGKIVRLAES